MMQVNGSRATYLAQKSYEEEDNRSFRSFTDLLLTLNRSVRPRENLPSPESFTFTRDEFAMAATAVMEGFAHRAAVGWPDGIDETLPGKVMIALASAALCIDGDDPPSPPALLAYMNGESGGDERLERKVD